MDFPAIERALITMGKALTVAVQKMEEQTELQREILEVLKEIRDKGKG